PPRRFARPKWPRRGHLVCCRAMRDVRLSLLALLVSCASTPAPAPVAKAPVPKPAPAAPAPVPSGPQPPVAKRIPHPQTLHGRELADDYYWLREKDKPDVVAYLQAESAFADAGMQPTVPLQEKLYKEILGRVQETDVTVPYRDGGYFYYTRTVEGLQYPIHCRKSARGA